MEEMVRLVAELDQTADAAGLLKVFPIENGDAVFTSWYLLKQGECCGNGCRNCPYPAAQ